MSQAHRHVHDADQHPRQVAGVCGQDPRQVAGDQRLGGGDQGESPGQCADEGAPDVQVDAPPRREQRRQDRQRETRGMKLHRDRQGGTVQQAPPRMRPFAQSVCAGQMQRRRQDRVGRLPRQAAEDETPGRQPVDGEPGDQEPCAQGAPDAEGQDGDGNEVRQTGEQSRGPIVGPQRERAGGEERQQGARGEAVARDRRQVAGREHLEPGQQHVELVAEDPLARPEQRLQRGARGQNRRRESVPVNNGVDSRKVGRSPSGAAGRRSAVRERQGSSHGAWPSGVRMTRRRTSPRERARGPRRAVPRPSRRPVRSDTSDGRRPRGARRRPAAGRTRRRPRAAGPTAI